MAGTAKVAITLVLTVWDAHNWHAEAWSTGRQRTLDNGGDSKCGELDCYRVNITYIDAASVTVG